MPRLPRIHVEGSVYYVTSKSNDNQRIFRDPMDTKMYLELLANQKKQRPFKLYAFCLVPERLALLLEPLPGSKISEIMHDLNSNYTKYFNSRYQRRGHLFEARFKSAFVEKSRHLAELTRHVHRLARVSAEALTSYASYMKGVVAEAPDMAAEVREVLDSAGLNSDGYAKYSEAVTADEEKLLEKRLARGGILGSEDFVQKVKNSAKEAAEIRAETLRPQAGRFRRLLAAALVALVLTTAFSIYFYVTRERLKERYENVVRQMQESLAGGSPLSSAAEEAG